MQGIAMSPGFRLTIRNVNYYNKLFMTQEMERFRLTIRNVNSYAYASELILFLGFRLTIRNVNTLYLTIYLKTD